MDSNYDGKLSPSDPVWAELKVWQDLNQNGSRDAGEAKTLSAHNITELNYAMGTFTQVNQTTGAVSVKQLSSPDLEADKDGTRVTVVPEGILVQASSDGGYYKNRSCLRTYSLGYRSRTYPKMSKNFGKRSRKRAGKTNEAQKEAFLGIKRSQSRLFICVSNYALHSENQPIPPNLLIFKFKATASFQDALVPSYL